MNVTALKTLAWLAMLGCVLARAEPADDPVKSAPSASEKAQPPPAQPTPRSSAETAALLRDFEQARQAYLAKRAALHQASDQLTPAQRQASREQLKALREDQTRAREELRQQLRLLREQLPSHRQLIDEALDRPGQRPRRGD